MPDEVTTPFRLPWEAPAAPAPATRSVEEIVANLQRDFEYATVTTSIIVHSNNPLFTMLANTRRGQLIPRGECKFTDGTTVELQDMGMCQPNVPYMSVQEIMDRVWELAKENDLELVS